MIHDFIITENLVFKRIRNKNLQISRFCCGDEGAMGDELSVAPLGNCGTSQIVLPLGWGKNSWSMRRRQVSRPKSHNRTVYNLNS